MKIGLKKSKKKRKIVSKLLGDFCSCSEKQKSLFNFRTSCFLNLKKKLSKKVLNKNTHVQHCLQINVY